MLVKIVTADGELAIGDSNKDGKIRTGDANAILWYTVDDKAVDGKIFQCWRNCNRSVSWNNFILTVNV